MWWKDPVRYLRPKRPARLPVLSGEGVVKAYDPNWVVCPGEFIADWMEEHNMTARVLATSCGKMPLDLLNGIITGRRKIDADTAEGLYLGTGISKVMWLNLEMLYREGLKAGKVHSHDV